MELDRIEQLLEKYFEGETTLAEEKVLKKYFVEGDVAPHLESYTPLFNAFAEAKEEKFTGEINLPKERPLLRWIPLAAGFAIVIGVFFTYNGSKTQHDYGTYKDPEIAALKAKQTLYMVSSFIDEGTEQLEVLGEFQKTTDKYLK